MRILILTTNSSLLDGINRHILAVAPALNRLEGIEVAVCTVLPAAELNRALESEGVASYSLGAPNGHDAKIIARFRKVLNEFKPDVIHSHVMALCEKLVLATSFKSAKLVRTVHGISDPVTRVTMKMRVENIIDRMFHLKWSHTCYISQGVMDELHKPADGSAATVVYNPISCPTVTDRPNRLHDILGIDGSAKIVGTSCRIANVKRPETFTEIMCEVLKRDANVHAVVFGDGDESIKASCREIVAKYGVGDRFHWSGYRMDAPELVRDLDCFVLTSRSEGLPTSLLECMAGRTPFAFMEGRGGLKDIAILNLSEGPFAGVAPEGDTEAMVGEILRLIGNPAQSAEYAERAAIVCKKYFDVEAVARTLQKIYQSL